MSASSVTPWMLAPSPASLGDQPDCGTWVSKV